MHAYMQLLTAGSCLTPAGAAGLYTIRPTLGCYNSSDGLLPFQYTRDTVGEGTPKPSWNVLTLAHCMDPTLVIALGYPSIDDIVVQFQHQQSCQSASRPACCM